MTSTPEHSSQSDFMDLRSRIAAQGLLERTPGFFVRMASINAVCITAAVIILILGRNHLWVVLLDALFFAFVYGQFGHLGHDAGHRQVSRSHLPNSIVGKACAFVTGLSEHAWIENHNQHHSGPNREDCDPDIDFPLIAFSEKQALERTGRIARFIIRNQGILFPILVPLTAVSLRITAAKYVLNNPKKAWSDGVLLVAHWSLYLGLVFILLPWQWAIPFIAIHQWLFGTYLAMVFAPNHKGMEILEADAKVDFLREQVLTCRNVRGGWFVVYWYGALNYQVEHHLFPTMPRGSLVKANKIVKQFCEERGIPYHETGVVGSYREIFAHMSSVARFARKAMN